MRRRRRHKERIREQEDNHETLSLYDKFFVEKCLKSGLSKEDVIDMLEASKDKKRG